jgi:hypothetical protein
VHQRHPVSLLLPQSALFLADQARLGDPDRRDIQQHPEMTRQAETARMGVALSIAQDQIGPGLELVPRLQHRRHLAEGEIARDVGKPRLLPGDGLFDGIKLREAQHHYRRPRHRPVVLEADIDARHAPHLADAIARNHFIPQRLLNRPRLGHGLGPFVMDVGFQKLTDCQILDSERL